MVCLEWLRVWAGFLETVTWRVTFHPGVAFEARFRLKSAEGPLTQRQNLCLEWQRIWAGYPETVTWKIKFWLGVAFGARFHIKS